MPPIQVGSRAGRSRVQSEPFQAQESSKTLEYWPLDEDPPNSSSRPVAGSYASSPPSRGGGQCRGCSLRHPYSVKTQVSPSARSNPCRYGVSPPNSTTSLPAGEYAIAADWRAC